MVSASIGPMPIREDDRRAVGEYLLSFRWPYRDAANHRLLVAGGLPLWTTFLRYVPNPPTRGAALELGSPPFFVTLLLQRFRNYDLTLTGATADGRPTLEQTLESPAFGERHHFVCTCFDIERDPFPFEDARFDLVTWCEVIEHLTENPVHTLAEIHRVLKPGGYLVVSTPNASRADNIATLLKGGNIYQPYHLGAPLKGSRHSREYTLAELVDLVRGCGFEVEQADDLDIYPPSSSLRRVFRFAMNHLVAPLTGGRYRYHLFLRARKTPAPFRWRFPPEVFDQGHLNFYLSPRDAAAVVGENEIPHFGIGWSEVRTGPEGRPYRRSGDVGDILLALRRPATAVAVFLFGGKGEAQAWQRVGGELVPLGHTPFEAPSDSWREVVVAFAREPDPSVPVHLRLDVPGGVNVHRAELRITAPPALDPDLVP